MPDPGAQCVHHREAGPGAGNPAGRGHPHGGVAFAHTALPQRHQREYRGNPGILRPGKGEGDHLLRYGDDPAGGGQGVLLSGAGQALPGPAAEISSEIRVRL